MTYNQNIQLGHGNVGRDHFLQQFHEESINNNTKSDLKEVYMCQCGRQYLSFPATYLHFRTKHDIKLSTKPTEQRKKVSIKGGVRTVTYLVNSENVKDFQEVEANFVEESQTSKHKQNFSQESQILQQCVEKYLCSEGKVFSQLYDQFIQYINESHYKITYKNEQFQIDKIPYLTNDFVLSFLPQCSSPLQIYSSSWKESCKELSRFCNWLRKENYTDLIVIYEES